MTTPLKMKEISLQNKNKTKTTTTKSSGKKKKKKVVKITTLLKKLVANQQFKFAFFHFY